jgi:hypothetical protein
MNGRVYDYSLGRFLSVDPVIQEPGNSQSLNPYTYIMNNPLSGTDPSGYASCKTTDSASCLKDGVNEVTDENGKKQIVIVATKGDFVALNNGSKVAVTVAGNGNKWSVSTIGSRALSAYEIGGTKYSDAEAGNLVSQHANEVFRACDGIEKCANGGYYFWGFSKEEKEEVKGLINSILNDSTNYNTKLAKALFRLGEKSDKPIIFYNFQIGNNAFAYNRNESAAEQGGGGSDAMILFDLDKLNALSKTHKFNGVFKKGFGDPNTPAKFTALRAEVIFHEMIHAIKMSLGEQFSSKTDGTKFDNAEEYDTIKIMNNVRLKWKRTDHR